MQFLCDQIYIYVYAYVYVYVLARRLAASSSLIPVSGIRLYAVDDGLLDQCQHSGGPLFLPCWPPLNWLGALGALGAPDLLSGEPRLASHWSFSAGFTSDATARFIDSTTSIKHAVMLLRLPDGLKSTLMIFGMTRLKACLFPSGDECPHAVRCPMRGRPMGEKAPRCACVPSPQHI